MSLFTDKRGAKFNVTMQPHPDGIQVVIEHPAYNGGKPIAVTGCRSETGAWDSVKAWTDHLSGDSPPENLISLDGEFFVRTS